MPSSSTYRKISFFSSSSFHLLFFLIGLSIGLSFIFLSTSSTNFTLTFFNHSSTYRGFFLLPSADDQRLPVDEEEELFRRALLVPAIEGYVPRVAFMFLTKWSLPLAPLWESFLQGHHGFYTIYVHSSPTFNGSDHPKDSIFYGKRIPSKAVEWGKPTMIDAERRLLANALLDITNQRFVLLSETCIPLYNFTTIYNYLFNSNRSFISSYDDPRKVGRGRYNPKMAPAINITQWRKGSQWFAANRRAAVGIVSDRKYYELFSQYCSKPCYMDEHYIPTLVSIVMPEENADRSLTWVDWSKSGPHPQRFIGQDVSQEFLERIRHGERCDYNGENTTVCYLFARKFVSNALNPLLKIAPHVLFGISELHVVRNVSSN